MKKLLKPSRTERKLIEEAGLDPRAWLIERKTHNTMQLVHREDNTQQTLSF